jgi:nucleoside-diphosphate-sugar epimerase
LVEEIAAFAPRRAVHLASLFLASHTPAQVDALIEANLRFSTAFAEACARAGAELFINTGTAWQRFGGEEYRPVNLYAATKEAFEAILRYYEDAMGMRSITIRLGDTYGPDDPRKKLVSILIDHARSGASLAMSPGEQRINLVHVDDVVRGFVLAVETNWEAPSSERTFALRGTETVSLRELVARIGTLSGKDLNVNFGERPYREREVFEPETLTANLPGWSPEVSLDAGLIDLIGQTERQE